MYRYVIIDDEALIRKAIVKQISSLGLPLAWVGEAEDGEEGLALVERERPDIMLTDMRMPVMDGVSFLQAVTDRRSEAQLIVVSGYSDFEYTREAITSSVAGYILKPFDNEELRQALAKAIDRIEQTKLSRKNAMEIELELDLVRFSAWLCRQSDEDVSPRPESYSSEPLRAFLSAGSFVVAVLLEPSVSEKKTGANESEDFKMLPDGCLRFPHPDIPGVTLLVCSDALTGRQAATAKINACLAEYSRRAETIAAVSGECNSVQGLPRAYRSALSLLEARPFGRMTGVHRMSSNSGSPGEPAENGVEWRWPHMEDFLYEMEEGNEAQAVRLAADLFSTCRLDESFTLQAVKRICRTLYHRIVEHLGSVHRISPDARLEMLPLLSHEIDAEAFERHFLQFVRDAVGQVPGRTAKAAGLSQQIKQYIDRHYAHQLTLEEVADRFFLHPVYLSVMFKEKMGETFQDYLRRIRIERAKHLLLTTKYRIDRISVMTGYENTKYFYKVFKKETGYTPTDYRQQQLGE
ncbi:response regulator transcription factor [Cohnella silvisoli]|uniref:Response regulator n=1 Tax=Cohnella silvisoli TaxID=2873699 RepID=A0ABV1KZA8_9BACL|nr:response regulator [Cohnella silvisoli]MCD9024763.1 response regulator [Cohnella silvisoli]